MECLSPYTHIFIYPSICKSIYLSIHICVHEYMYMTISPSHYKQHFFLESPNPKNTHHFTQLQPGQASSPGSSHPAQPRAPLSVLCSIHHLPGKHFLINQPQSPWPAYLRTVREINQGAYQSPHLNHERNQANHTHMP